MKKLLAMVKEITADEYLRLLPYTIDFKGERFLQHRDSQGNNVTMRLAFRGQYWICFSVLPLDLEDVETHKNIGSFFLQAITNKARLIMIDEFHNLTPEAAMLHALRSQECLEPLDLLVEFAEQQEAEAEASQSTLQ